MTAYVAVKLDSVFRSTHSRAGFAGERAEHLKPLSRLTDELNSPHTDVCSRCDSPRTAPRWQRLTLAPARQSLATSHSPQTGIAEVGDRDARSTYQGEGIAQVRALAGARLSDALSLRQRHNPADATSEARSLDGSGQRYDRLDLLCTLRERTVVVVDNPAGARAKRGVSTGSLSSTTRPRPYCDLTDAPRTPARDPRGRTQPSGFVRLHARARAL